MEGSSISLDYRAIIRSELAKRLEQNPRYSLRAFARDLGLSPSRVSEIINAKQGLSLVVAGKVAKKLGFEGERRDLFFDLVESQHARSPKDRQAAMTRLEGRTEVHKVYQIEQDDFRMISDWYHGAILEMMLLKSFDGSAKWLRRRVKIPLIKFELALQRLERLGFIAQKDGKFVLSEPHSTVLSDVPSESIRKFHKQILEQAVSPLDKQKIDQREYLSAFLAIDQSQLPEAKQELKNFWNKFCKKTSEAKELDSVYCIAIQFFRIDEGEGVCQES
ncbi:MAG: TIGR02147 family protein [Oligoflexales bacterium]